MCRKPKLVCGVAILTALLSSACLATQDASLGARVPSEEEDEIETASPAAFDAGAVALLPLDAGDAAASAPATMGLISDAAGAPLDAGRDASPDAAHDAAAGAAHDGASHFDARARECKFEPWECR